MLETQPHDVRFLVKALSRLKRCFTMLKRIILLMLCALLMCTACSKDKDKDKSAKSNAATASRTVDLGENDDSADEPGDKNVRPRRDRARDDRKPGRFHPRKDAGAEDALPPEEVARRNMAAGMNEDGSSKRGKPAEELLAEEKAGQGMKGHVPNRAKDENTAEDEQANENAGAAPNADAGSDAVAENAETNEKAQDGFDFAEEANADAGSDAEKAKDEPITERIVQKRKGLNIDNVISIKEIREQTGYAGALSQTDLPGQPEDTRYNVIRLSTDKDSELGFTVQVWKPGNESAASRKFDDMFKQSFGGEKVKDVATDAFVASHHNLNELAFFDKGRRAVVLLSCSDSVCKKDSLKGIAGVVQRRL